MTGRRPNPTLWSAIVGLPVLFVALFALQTRIDARTRSAAQQKEELLLQSGTLLKKVSLGYDALLADLYWTRTVQYYGTNLDRGNSNFELLAPLLNMTVTLDPKLIVAYRFGSIFLSERPPIGPGRPDLATQLIQRGIDANPGDWHLYFDLGFLYFWHFHDYIRAAVAYQKASEVPDSPEWLKVLAARMADQKEALETSRIIWTRILESSHDSMVRETALRHLTTLRVQLDEGWLNDASEDYRKRFGHYPASIEDLRKAGLLRGVPLDPHNFPYLIGPDGKGQLNPKSTVVLDTAPESKAQ
jgi:tetratricopeptide (TPR) repeat protein